MPHIVDVSAGIAANDPDPLVIYRRTDFKVPDESDPVPCSGAVLLNLLRHMLVTEESSGAARYTGRLALLRGAPRRWFADGCVISMQQAPTHFGKVSFRVESRAGQGAIRAEVAVPDRCRGIVLRLRHPMGAPMKSVLLNGQPHQRFDPARETIELEPPAGPCRVEARF